MMQTFLVLAAGLSAILAQDTGVSAPGVVGSTPAHNPWAGTGSQSVYCLLSHHLELGLG